MNHDFRAAVAGIEKLVDGIAATAMGQAPDQRDAFIEALVESLRQDYRAAYAASPIELARALDFAGKVEEWARVLVAMAERDAGQPGSA